MMALRRPVGHGEVQTFGGTSMARALRTPVAYFGLNASIVMTMQPREWREVADAVRLAGHELDADVLFAAVEGQRGNVPVMVDKSTFIAFGGKLKDAKKAPAPKVEAVKIEEPAGEAPESDGPDRLVTVKISESLHAEVETRLDEVSGPVGAGEVREAFAAGRKINFPMGYLLTARMSVLNARLVADALSRFAKSDALADRRSRARKLAQTIRDDAF